MSKGFNHTLKAALTAAFLFFVVSAAVAAEKKTPDFAFPETVERDATPIWKAGIKEKDGKKALTGALQLIVARNQVSAREALPANIAMLDSAARVLPAPYGQLASLLEANLYAAVYRQNRWTYDQRTLPTDSFPSDPYSWNGDLFAKKTLELVNGSMTDPEVAKGIKIEEISPLLNNWKNAAEAGESVFDFLTYNGVEQLQTFGAAPAANVIPFGGKERKRNLTIPEQCYSTAVQMLAALEEWHKAEGISKALVITICERAKTLGDNGIDAAGNSEKTMYLRDWAEKLADNELAGPVLHALYDDSNRYPASAGRTKTVYDTLKGWYDRYPNGFGAVTIKGDLAAMSQPGATVTLKNTCFPNTTITGKGKLRNAETAYVLVYKIPKSMLTEGESLDLKMFPKNAKFVSSIPVSVKEEVPFEKEIEFEIPGLPAGYYVAIPSPTKTLPGNWKSIVEWWSMQVFNVTDITLVASYDRKDPKSGRVYVVEGHTQRPVEGANVTIYAADNKVIKNGVTDKEGGVDLPVGYTRVEAVKNGSTATQRVGFYTNDNTPRTTPAANILTDLAIYKPGDKVRFTIVGWLRGLKGNTLLKNEGVKVIMRDANWNPVDTLSLTTDERGRAHGEFTLPRNGLLGTFQLMANFDSYKNEQTGHARFEVAEYKTPTFYVDLEKDASGVPDDDGMIRFNGVVKTYSGMPLPDTEVEYSIKWQPWWRWWGGGVSSASYGDTVRTDAAGKFVIELPTTNLKGTEFQHGIFTMTASSTSQAGETQQSQPLRFSIGEDYSVGTNIPSKIECCGDSIRFSVTVNDILGMPVKREVEYRIAKICKNEEEPETVDKGVFASPSLTIPSSKLPSGKYRLSFNLVGDTVKTDSETVIWRKSDKTPPYATPLWVPETERVNNTDKEKTVEVTVGSGYADSWLLAMLSTPEGIVKREWIKSDGKNVKIKVPAAVKGSKVWLTLNGLHDFSPKTETVTIIPESSTRKMKVETVTFRDRISSGDKETWTFKFTTGTRNGQPEPADVAAFAVMTDKSLNAITPFRWEFNAGGVSVYNISSMQTKSPNSISTSSYFRNNPRQPQWPDYIAGWETYGYGFGPGMTMRRNMKMAARAAGAVNTVSDDGEEMLTAVMTTSAPLYASAEMVKDEMKVESAADEVSLEEPETEDSGAGKTEKEELRPIEMPLAFFMPDLTGNNAGEVAVEFTTPNFNTTWQFQLMGYTDDLLTAGIVKDAVASKEVMVKCNAPRYLRTGDKGVITAMLFNNSDHELALHGEIILFDPLTGETIISRHTGAENTAPTANRTITVDYEVPADIQALGIRAYAYGENHSDGEQTVIPVLPSSTPVVESTQFYIGRDSQEFSKKLPKYGKDDNLTLKYCDNPVWECVLALPTISTPDSKNVLTLAKALYANALATGIIRDYPQVKAGLESVFAAGDSTAVNVLKSKLEKDAGLKTVELINTPWVNNASSETLRMRELDKLLDTESNIQTVATLTEQIKKLQKEDGGWSWCEGMESSEFITRRVLLTAGMLGKSGNLPETMTESVNKGIAYCDREILKDYRKSGNKYSAVNMLDYLYVRSFFKAGDGPKGFSGLEQKALKSISEDWRGFSTADMAKAAMVLERSSKYAKTSRMILESLRQTAKKSESLGWEYDNLRSGYNGYTKLATTATVLEAFAEIEPEAEAVDGLRQWLVLQKETEDWGADSNTVGIIQAILSSGSDWTEESAAPEIMIGDKGVSLPEREMLTGIITMNLTPEIASGKTLTVRRNSDGPAWGGVVSQYVAPIKDVRSESCDNLSVEKAILIVRETESGEKVTSAPMKGGKIQLKTGDKVRVTLTLTCGKDMDYVALIDERSACLEPEEQLSGYTYKDGLGMYREVRDSKTGFFIGFLPKGVNVISYDCRVDREGEYSIGIASAQSQYSPLQSAHSSGAVVVSQGL